TDPYGLYLDASHDDEGPSAVFYVADAAANNLVKLGPYGKFSIKASFPNLINTGAESVPTAVTRGPDGALYVSELTGFPFTVGAARIWRIAPDGSASIYATGFTNIIDLAFGPDHKLYVLEIAKNGLLSNDLTGALIRYDAHNHKQTEIASD